MTRRTTLSRPDSANSASNDRACDYNGCACAGEHRAPKGRDALNSYWWFCLEHVRAYNAGWDFYKGMSPGQIEAQLRADTAWQRPTWPMGRLGGGYLDEDVVYDPLKVLAARRAKRAGQPRANTAPSTLRQPLEILGLQWPVSLQNLKARYKELAKKYHPDTNGGNLVAEQQFKSINLAYTQVRQELVDKFVMS